MAERTQVNFRIDTDLLTAIKQKCEAEGISTTDFFINAAKTALGIETMDRTTLPSLDALESLGERLEELEKRLAERIAALEAQQLGELVA